MSKYSQYIEISTRAICDAGMTFDLARSAEKMTSWEYLGQENDAWKQGPYLSSPQNKAQIDHSYPYCIKTSIYFAKIGELVMGNNFSPSGRTQIPVSSMEKNNSRV